MKVAGVRHDTSADGAVHHLVLDGPPANVVGMETCSRLCAEVEAVVADERAKLIVLRGEGKHFSFGASVEEHLPEQAGDMLAGMRRTVLSLATAPVPTLAAVRGRCLGGGFELALACGWILATEDSILAAPEIRLGVIAPFAMALLEGSVPRTVAEDLLLSGRDLEAAAAKDAGIVTDVVPAGGLDAAVEAPRRGARPAALGLRSPRGDACAAERRCGPTGEPPRGAREGLPGRDRPQP